VLDQSYQNIEIIVVDDGSTDDTKNIMDQFKYKIKYIYIENSGPAHARNVGLKAAKGKYLAFLDSDDLYLPHKLELQVSFMEQHPEVGMVSTEMSAFNDTGFFEKYHLRSYHQIYKWRNWSYEDIYSDHGEFTCPAVKKPVPYYQGNIFRYTLLGSMVISNTIMFRKEILDIVGYQNEINGCAEDLEFVIRLCKHCLAGFINYPTYLYRYHNEQISFINQEWKPEKALIDIRVEKVMLQTILDFGIGDKDFYNENASWLNRRVAELYHYIGEQWLEIGDSREARNSFKNGLSFDPFWQTNREYYYLSFLPSIIRRIFFGVLRRLRKLDILKALKKMLYPITCRYLANATLVEGNLKGTDMPFRCLFIENSNMMEYVCRLSFQSDPHILKKWKIWLPALQKTVRENSLSIDLCIAVLPKHNACGLSTVCDYEGDEWVRQYIDTSGKWEEIRKHFHQKKRQYTNNLSHKYGLSYRISHDMSDLDLFYNRMYLPLIKNKYNNEALILPYKAMKGYLQKGLLLFVTAENRDIAGGLCSIDDAVMFFAEQGVLDGSDIYIQQGAQIALYYFIILYASENGLAKLDVMKTRPSLNDTVYRTKREWGATVYADYEAEASVYYLVPRFSETISAYFNTNPAIINEEDGLYGLAGWPEGHDIAELSNKYYSPGLKGMILLSPNGVKMKVPFDEVCTQGPK
jgi:glycosyltransferase involved in cell wall biosynthesis